MKFARYNEAGFVLATFPKYNLAKLPCGLRSSKMFFFLAFMAVVDIVDAVCCLLLVVAYDIVRLLLFLSLSLVITNLA